MKILNIHGYREKSDNSAAVALKELGYECISPTIDYVAETGFENNISDNMCISPIIDYGAKKPEIVFGKLTRILLKCSPEIIVGTGLGGFYAALLSAQNDLPVILINPCLMPFYHLPKLGYKGDTDFFLSQFWKLSELKSYNVCTIVGGNDEIIDTHSITKSMLNNARYKEIPDGKHSGATLPLKDFINKMINYVKSKSFKAEKRIDIFCSSVHQQLAERLITGELFKKGNRLIWTNLNGNHNITIESYDSDNGSVKFIVDNEKKRRTLNIDEMYILDKDWLDKLYNNKAKAIQFNNQHDAPNVSGVYILYNEKENKYYVGQAKNIRNRMFDHYQKNSKVKIDKLLQNESEAIKIEKKYIRLDDSGFSNLDALETAFIAYFNSFHKGYNKTRGNKLLHKGKKYH